MDQQRFLQQLQIVLDPKRGDVKAATNILQNEFYKQPEALLFLIHLIVSHDSSDLKQLAATQGRPLVSRHWTKIADEQRKQARSQLFQATMSEGNSLARHSASRLISAIAKVDLDDGEWNELPGLLQQAATSPKAEERAVGVYLLFSILETMGTNFSGKFKELFTLFSDTIKDPESLDVRVNTLMALSKMAMVIDAEDDQNSVKAFQSIVPAMVTVLKDTITSGKEEQTMLAFEVFNTLLTAEYQLLSKHFSDLVVFMNEISTNSDFSDDARTQAISFLMQCVMYRRLRVQGLKMGPALTKSALQVVTEIDEISDDDDITPGRSALGLIDTLAQHLPAVQVLAPLLELLPQYSSHQDAGHRRAGILALGYAVEGAPDFLSTQLSQVFPILFALLEDSDVSVRQAALQTTARLADDLPEDIARQHALLMPLLIQNLTAAMQGYNGEEEGPAIDIMKSGSSAIASVVDGMAATDAETYLEKLAPLLQKLFQAPDFKIKALAASALGSLASTVEKPFLPYLKDSMVAMQEFVTKKESEDELELRASCTDAMGEMALAVGPAEFKDYVGKLMAISEEALNLDHSRLKETTYILWGSLAKVYEEEFGHFLEGVVKGLFDCIDQEEDDIELSLGANAKDLLGKEVTIAGRKVKVAAADSDDEAEDGSIEDVEIDNDDDSDWGDLNTVTPLVLEKEIAIEVVGDVLSNTKGAYLPYFEKTIEKLLPLTEHPYENIRKATMSSLHRAYAALYEISEEKAQIQKYVPGLPVQVELTSELKKLGEVLMSATLNLWPDEDDGATVTEISRALSENLKMTGPSLVSYPDVLGKVVQIVTSLITKKHPCQMDLEEEVDIDEMDSSELEWLVVDSAMDVISGLAVALGPSFAELWKIFEKQVLRYASGGESLGRASACGVLAEIITGMDGAVTPFTSTILQVLLRRLGDEDNQTKSNAAYAVGRLVEKSQDSATIVKAYPTILTKLEPLFSITECRCTDNAAGSLARLILAHKDQVPLQDVLPAFVNSGVLPLKEDYEENEPVWTMIIELYKAQDATVQSLTPKLAPAMMSVLGSEEEVISDELKSQLQSLVDHLKNSS